LGNLHVLDLANKWNGHVSSKMMKSIEHSGFKYIFSRINTMCHPWILGP
jgi:hypothetical protein